jgi:NADH:ubiquinone oxidoreductase subunit B-like Fe-S oxidoreductase
MMDVNRIVLLDVCAPEFRASPEALMHAIFALDGYIRTSELFERHSEGRSITTDIDPAQGFWTPDVPVAVRMGTPK